DVDANHAGGPLITTASSRVPAWVIPTNEELMIAHHTRELIR
ncbi:acetate kinase, partial [Pseudomonas sp. MWU12-2534b]